MSVKSSTTVRDILEPQFTDGKGVVYSQRLERACDQLFQLIEKEVKTYEVVSIIYGSTTVKAVPIEALKRLFSKDLGDKHG